MTDTISFLFSASVTIFRAMQHLYEKNQEKRETAEKFLRDIAETIQDIIREHEKGNIPHGKCAKIREFVEIAPEVLRNVVSEPNIDLFIIQLREASDVERFLMFMQTDETVLYKLKVAQWNFSSAADKLKLTP